MRIDPEDHIGSLISIGFKQAQQMKSIYVGNLPFSATEDEVQGLFAAFGEVSRVHLVNDRETGRPRGFGFVEMSDDDSALKAIESLDQSELDGRTLRISEAQPRESRTGGGGGGGGGGNWGRS
jgi:RNA recognition motif-containing protein